MAYVPRNLKVVAGKRNRTDNKIWMYTSEDAMTLVRAANYFSDALARGMLPNDIVYVYTVNSSNVLQSLYITVALTVAASGANLADGTAITITNT